LPKFETKNFYLLETRVSIPFPVVFWVMKILKTQSSFHKSCSFFCLVKIWVCHQGCARLRC